MNDRERLTQQMADIGSRYIRRTLGELDGIRALLDQARSGDAGSVRDIERMAHKIRGSGAMFGFDAVSDRAGEVELLAESGACDGETVQRLQSLIDALQVEVQAAARARGVE